MEREEGEEVSGMKVVNTSTIPSLQLLDRDFTLATRSEQ
jgi:hypothetical protein